MNMSYHFKKNFLMIISILNTIAFCFYFGSEIASGTSITGIIYFILAVVNALAPFILLKFFEEKVSFYFLSVFFAIDSFISINIPLYLIGIISLVVSLLPCDKEKISLAKIIKRHPLFASFTIIISGMSFLQSSSVLEYLGDSLYGFDMLGELIASVFIFGLIMLSRKKKIVYQNNGAIQDALMVSLPFIIFIIYLAVGLLSVNIASGNALITIDEIVITIIFYLAVGFFEEFLIRGMVLNILIEKFGNDRRGIWKSVILSSTFFGLIHFVNILTGASWQGVLIQMIAATFIGIYLASIYLRSGSVWTTVLLHGIYDLVISIPTFFVTDEIVDTIVQYAESISNYSWASALFAAIYVLLALFLLRKKKMADVVAIREGKYIYDKHDDLAKVIVVIFISSFVALFSYSIFNSFMSLRHLADRAYQRITMNGDHSYQYSLPFVNGELTYENMSDEMRLLLAIKNLEDDDFEYSHSISDAEDEVKDQAIITYVKEEKVEKSLQEIFGQKSSFQAVDVDISHKTTCSFESQQKRYVCTTTNNDQDDNIKIYSNISEINLESGTEIEYSVYYLVEDLNTNTLYTDIDLKTVLAYDTTIKDLTGDVTYDENDDKNTEFWKAIMDAMGEIPTYRLTFKSDSLMENVSFQKSEFIFDSVTNVINKEENIADSTYQYDTQNYHFIFNKKDFSILEEKNRTSLVKNGIIQLKIEQVASDDWLPKYKNSNGRVTFGNNEYAVNKNEYLIYKNNFYIIEMNESTDKKLRDSLIDVLNTLQFKDHG